MGRGKLISIISLYNWDNTIFDGLIEVLPQTVTDPDISITSEPLDGDTLIGNIMFSLGELSIIYNNPETLKFYIGLWAKKNKLIWQKLYDTLYYNYDPLFSKIREYKLSRDNSLERYTRDNENETSQYARDLTDNSQTNVTGNDSNLNENGNTRTYNTSENTSQQTSGEEINYKQAFNDIGVATWSADTRSTSTENSSGSDAMTGTVTDAGRSEDTGAHNELTTSELTREIADTASKILSKNGSLTDTGKLQDIIYEKITGQRAYQELIDLQRRLAMFNLYDFIIDQFKSEFCIMIY